MVALGKSYSSVSQLQARAKSSHCYLCNKVVSEHGHAPLGIVMATFTLQQSCKTYTI